MRRNHIVHVVDDDEAVRHSVAFVLRHEGFRVETHVSGVQFLAAAKTAEPGCVLLDVRMPEIDGLEVQNQMRALGIHMPVVILTGHGDIATAIKAVQAGAVNFLEKPYEKQALLAAIEECCARLEKRGQQEMDTAEAAALITRLTRRERDVLSGMVSGKANKSIAVDLGISARTVEIYRANLMEKLGARSLSHVLRIAFIAEGGSSAPPVQGKPT